MELRQLRYFIAVAEELHFARAAARVGIAQSPLSKAIKDFEAELGVRLFFRTTRNTRLTRAGESFLSDARCVLAAAESATWNLAQEHKSFLLGIEPGLSSDRLTPWLARCRPRILPVELRLNERKHMNSHVPSDRVAADESGWIQPAGAVAGFFG